MKADNGHGVWSEEHAVVGFQVNPRWWEIAWLRAIALLGIVVGGVTYYQRRLQKIKHANTVLQRAIEERQRAEAEADRRFDQLARVARAASTGELTSSIAHEVKQPLFAIVSNAQTARRLLDRNEPDVAKIHGALADIVSDGNRASSIIDHIRSLVKKERQPTHLLDLNDLAAQVTQLAESEMRKRGLKIKTQFAKELPLVKGDPVEIQQVIINLVINGAQAMSRGDSTIWELLITTARNKGYVELSVRDTGVGLGETQPETMFEPFYTTRPDGTGMGLSINRTIIEAHGGKIWAIPNPDQGATFWVSLPVKSENGQ